MAAFGDVRVVRNGKDLVSREPGEDAVDPGHDPFTLGPPVGEAQEHRVVRQSGSSPAGGPQLLEEREGF